MQSRWNWALFGVFCIVASSWWIVDERWPDSGEMFTLSAKVWACGIGAVVASAVAVARRRAVPTMRDVARLAAVGVGLLALSSFGVLVGGVAARPVNVAAALCLAPIMVAVMESAWSERPMEFWPGLVGLAGASQIFPMTLRMGAAAYVGLLVPALAVAAACVACRKVARGVAIEWAIALIFIGGEAGLAVMEFPRKFSGGNDVPSFSPLAVALDLLLAGIVVVLVLRMDVRRYVSVYFIVPGLTVLEGLVLIPAALFSRLGAGMVLMGIAAFALLRERRTVDGTSVLRLR